MNLPRGLSAGTSERGLVARDDSDSIYWGGALFCFAADVNIRQATNGRKSLDDFVRAALARGGDATHVWTVLDAMRTGDEVTGTTILSEMYERHALRNEAIDLDDILRSMEDTRVWIRRAIVERPAGSGAVARMAPQS